MVEERLQLTKHQSRQINRQRTLATFHRPRDFKNPFMTWRRLALQGKTLRERSSWMSLLIIFIDPSVGSHPVPKRRCTREIFGSTFNGSRVLQGKAGRPDVCKAIESMAALTQGPSHDSTVLVSVVLFSVLS